MKKGQKFLLGAHTSASGGAYRALLEGKEIGATTIQLFTSNQKRWEGKPLQQEDVDLWNDTLKETELTDIMSHDSYLINLGAPNEENLLKSRKAFIEEIKRCEALQITYLNFHPGACLTTTEDACLDLICESLLLCEEHIKNVRLLLETTAGQGSSVGYRFEHLAYIISRVKHKIPIGVCIDTCHIFAAGYDLRDQKSFEKTFEEFDKRVGLQHLYAFHLNDSLKGLGSRVDRHQPLGEGMIGIEAFKLLMQDERTKYLPKYLETPGGIDQWKKEIPMLHSFGDSLCV
jgi:deoxyribonuclease-4